MDVPLELPRAIRFAFVFFSFNPCFNGCASRIFVILNYQDLHQECFNPCFNGCASRMVYLLIGKEGKKKCFNPCFNGCASRMSPFFVILSLSRIKKSDYSLPLFLERYMKLSFHTAQAFYNPFSIGQQLIFMVSVIGLQILFTLYSTFFFISVSFLIPCLSFLETKYSVSSITIPK